MNQLRPESRAEHQPSSAALGIARRALRDDADWFTIEGVAPPSGTTCIGDLVAGGGAGIEHLVPVGAPPVAYVELVSAVGWSVLWPLVRSVADERALLAVDVSSIRFEPPVDGGEPDRVWWPPGATVAEVIDDDAGALAAYRRLVAMTIEACTPLVEAVRARAAYGRVGLWSLLADVFRSVGPS
ncbi:MAG: hypothetical protein AAF547_14820 [Actinomycetota bacterium]